MSKKLKRLASLATTAAVMGSTLLNGIPTFASSGITCNAMSPLHINNWDSFNNDLQNAKDIGVNAISVDVWWGDVEKNGDNQFDFSYYDSVFKAITDKGLDIVPIMSFHQCGGNVGDDYTSTLPSWVWDKYSSYSIDGVNLTADNLKYKSSLGNSSKEYLALWADEVVNNEYIDFMNAFEDHFASYAKDMQEINISGGPSGELRYPSYNSHDGSATGYPTKGALQCYSDLAKANFKNEMLDKYNNLDGINAAWGTSLTDESQIGLPSDGDEFFYNGSNHPYYETQYGKDVLDWYNGSLVEHGDRMLGYAKDAFNDEFEDVDLGIKIPGVHWQYANTSTPRGAEVSAGLINSDFSSGNGYGYNPILKMVKDNDAILHFTCLEMNDQSGEQTSFPKTLVQNLGTSAQNLGVTLKGENALAGGEDYDYYWNNLRNAVANYGYDGITILRLNDAVNNASYNYYKSFIKDFGIENPDDPVDPTELASVNFSINNATTYMGQNVYVVGNVAALGSWDPSSAVKLSPTNYPTWTSTISNLPANTTIEFKFIKMDDSGNITWESGSNRTLTTGDANSTINFSDSWK